MLLLASLFLFINILQDSDSASSGDDDDDDTESLASVDYEILHHLHVNEMNFDTKL